MKKFNQLTFSKVKKSFRERGYKISKKNKIISESFSSFYYLSLASIFLVSFCLVDTTQLECSIG